MTASCKVFWDLLSEQCAVKSTKADELFLHQEKKEKFIEACNLAYAKIKKEYMHQGVQYLDRHKVCAIMIACGLDLDIIEHKSKVAKDPDLVFIGVHKLLLICAIHYLAQKINQEIKQANYADLKPMTRFDLPKSVSSQTNYIDSLCRLMIDFRQEKDALILNLSDRLFLLEYIAIFSFYYGNADSVFSVLKK